MRRRLVTLALASTTLVAFAFVVPLFVLVQQLAVDRAVRPAELTARSLAPAAALVDPDTLDDLVEVTAADLGAPVAVVLPDDSVVGASITIDDEIEQVRRDGAPQQLPIDGGRRVLVPVTGQDGVLVVDVRVPVGRRDVVLAWFVLAVLGACLVAGATLLADRLGRTTVQAARSLEATAVRLSAGQLDATARVDAPPDLARVSAALDQLASRIDQLLSEAREDAADLSHRLRTPLTALRLDVEALVPEEDRRRLLADMADLDAAVSQVIDDARAPVRVGAGGGCDLARVVADRLEFWTGLAEDEGRPVARVIPDQVTRVTMAESDVRTVVDVLLDNVFRHTPDGVAMHVGIEADDDTAVLVIADEGPGLPVGIDVRDRGRSGAGGSGLGLDIVHRAVQRVGGSFDVSGPPGVGTTVECRLPLAG